MKTVTRVAATVTERAMQEKDLYFWSFAGGKIEVRTPGTCYQTPYTITDDGLGNLSCSCPQGKKHPICKHTEAYRIDWHCRIPAATFGTAKNEAQGFRCDHCGDRVFTAPVKPCDGSGLRFCDEECEAAFLDGVYEQEAFFEALNAGELEGAAR